MNVDTIITHIKATCAIFEGRVAGAAELEAVENQTSLALPAAYVVPTSDAAQGNPSPNALRQYITEAFTVFVMIDNRADRRGQAAITQTVESVRKALFKSVLNLRVDLRAARGLEYVGGALESMDATRLIYSFEFEHDILITQDDGWQAPSEEWVATDILVTDRADPDHILAGAHIAMDPDA